MAGQSWWQKVKETTVDIAKAFGGMLDFNVSFDYDSSHSGTENGGGNQIQPIIAGVSPETITLVLIVIAGAIAYQIAKK